MAEEPAIVTKEQLEQAQINLNLLKDQKIQLEEAKLRYVEKLQVLKAEEAQRYQHYQTLKQLYENEIKNSGEKDQQSTQIQKAEANKKQQVRDIIFEKLSFHMDKYYIFIEECIKPYFQRRKEVDENLEIFAPTAVSAIQVKCLKAIVNAKDNNNNGQATKGDEEDYYVTTFRVSKKYLFSDLLLSACTYWELLSPQEIEAQKNFKGEGLDNQEYSGASQSLIYNGLQPIKRFEFTEENKQPVPDTESIDRYITSKQNKATDGTNQTITLILKKRKLKKKAGITGIQTTQLQITGAHSQKEDVSQISRTKVNEESKANDNPQDYGAVEEEMDDDDDSLLDEEMEGYQFVKVFRKLPLVRKYFELDKEEIIQTGKLRQHLITYQKPGLAIDDMSCCVLLVFCLLLLLNQLILMYQTNQTLFLSHVESLQDMLQINQLNNDESEIAWMQINSLQDLKSYLSDLNGFASQVFDQKSKLNQHYRTIGAFRMRQLRIKPRECPYPVRNNSQVTCIYENYNANSKQTQQIGDGSLDWQEYQSLETVGISRTTKGKFGTYDSSGFILDISRNQQSIQNYQNTVIQKLINSDQYFNVNTFAFLMTFNLVSKQDGTFIFLEYLLEYTSTGIFPQQPTIIPYAPCLFCTGSSSPISVYGQINSIPPSPPSEYGVGSTLYIIDIFRILLGVIYIFLFLICVKNNNINGLGFSYRYFITLKFITNLFVIFMLFFSIAKTQQHGFTDQSVEQMLQVNDFLDMGDIANRYQLLILLVGFSSSLIIVRLAFFLDFLKS